MQSWCLPLDFPTWWTGWKTSPSHLWGHAFRFDIMLFIVQCAFRFDIMLFIVHSGLILCFSSFSTRNLLLFSSTRLSLWVGRGQTVEARLWIWLRRGWESQQLEKVWNIICALFNLWWRSSHPSLGLSLLFGLKAPALIGNKLNLKHFKSKFHLMGQESIDALQAWCFHSWRTCSASPDKISCSSTHGNILGLKPLIIWHLQDTVTWTWDQPYGALTCIFLSLSQWSLR